MTDWITQKNSAAAAEVRKILDRPWPENPEFRSIDDFNPWDILPSVYGGYDSDFDECMIEVLINLRDGGQRRDDLAANIFREMLCVQSLCDYGTSPRVCFPTPEFRPLLDELIEKWKKHAADQWSGASDEGRAAG